MQQNNGGVNLGASGELPPGDYADVSLGPSPGTMNLPASFARPQVIIVSLLLSKNCL